MLDRLRDLRQGGGGRSAPARQDDDDIGDLDQVDVRIDMPSPAPAAAEPAKPAPSQSAKTPVSSQKDLGTFFDLVSRVKDAIKSIRDDTVKIQNKVDDVLNGIDGSATEKARDELGTLTTAAQRNARVVKNTIKQIEDEVKAMKDSDPTNPMLRIKENHAATLTRDFMDAMRGLQRVQNEYQGEIRKNVTRRIRIVKPDASENEIEAMMDEPEIFADQALQAGAEAMTAKTTWHEIQEKHRDIKKLEASMQELHQIFVELSVLVESQGELINNIRENVSSSVTYVEQGVQELEKARELQSKARKKMCCIILVMVVVAAVILGPLMGAL